MGVALDRVIERLRERLSSLTAGVRRSGVDYLVERRRENLAFIADRLSHAASKIMDERKAKFSLALEKLSALNPVSVMARGYSVVKSDKGVLTDASCVSVGESVNIRLANGSFDATVTNIKR
jgi:exodeoxyribonuclease VII large subunit